jgi:hypothetical protein
MTDTNFAQQLRNKFNPLQRISTLFNLHGFGAKKRVEKHRHATGNCKVKSGKVAMTLTPPFWVKVAARKKYP